MCKIDKCRWKCKVERLFFSTYVYISELDWTDVFAIMYRITPIIGFYLLRFTFKIKRKKEVGSRYFLFAFILQKGILFMIKFFTPIVLPARSTKIKFSKREHLFTRINQPIRSILITSHSLPVWLNFFPHVHCGSTRLWIPVDFTGKLAKKFLNYQSMKNRAWSFRVSLRSSSLGG